jgi:hypothetical protein
MAAQSIDLQARKRMLLAESEMYRQTLSSDVAHLTSATAWISTALHYARLVAPALAVAVPIAGFFFGSRKKRAHAHAHTAPAKKNLLGKVIAGYRIARQVKPILDGFRRVRTPH